MTFDLENHMVLGDYYPDPEPDPEQFADEDYERMCEERERWGSMAKTLTAELPAVALKIDEDGHACYPGFSGDCSQSARWVTDGHILVPAADLDDIAMAVKADPDDYGGKYATEAAIEEVWKAAEQRQDVAAEFIGCISDGRWGGGAVAFLRDARGRVMAVSADLLAWGIRAVRPDGLTVSADADELWDTPLALRRAALVGLLMPLRYRASDFPHHDLHGEPVKILAVAGRP